MKIGLFSRLGGAFAAMIGCAYALSGCLGDLTVAPPDGIGGAGGAGGGVGGGTVSLCEANTVIECVTGLSGACAGGKSTCSADGLSFGPCVPDVMPAFDDCRTPEDEDCNGTAIACTGMVDWVYKEAGAPASPNDDVLYGAAATADGGYIVTGVVDGDVNSGTTVNTGAMYIAKLDAMGTLVWKKKFTSSSMSAGRAVAVDKSGNFVVVGEFIGAMDVGAATLITPNNSKDIFIGQFTPNGDTTWAKRFGGASPDYAIDVALDSKDDIVFTGSVRADIVDFGGGAVNPDGDDVYVTKLDRNGAHLWSHVFVNANDQQGRGIAVTPQDDVIVVGDTLGGFSFGGPCAVPAFDMGGAFVARLSGANGSCTWAKAIDGANDQYARGVTTLANGNPVVTGRFAQTIAFAGGMPYVSFAANAGYVAEFDLNSGNHVRNVRFGDKSTFTQEVDVDPAGNVFVTGSFEGKIEFGGSSISSTSVLDAFVLKLDSESWSPLWMRLLGQQNNQYGIALAVNAQGGALAVGGFWSELSWGAMTKLQSTGGADLYAALLGP